MLIKRLKGWELPERLVTDEGAYARRRDIVKAMGLGAIALDMFEDAGPCYLKMLVSDPGRSVNTPIVTPAAWSARRTEVAPELGRR